LTLLSFVSLEHLILPANATFNNLYFSDFEGCGNLKWIDVSNDNTSFDTTKGYPFDVDDFKAQVGEQFYFIGSGSSMCMVHNNVTKEHSIAFMYRDSEIFEIIKNDDESGAKLTYQASKEGELLSITIDDTNKMFNADVPASVGPYDIKAIGSDFKGNKNIKTLHVPNTVENIAAEAFAGCVKLEKVVFEETNNIQSIGKDAFKTQAGGDNNLTPLTFEGRIDVNSVPFQYAMGEENYYNNDRQPLSYIDFCSGNDACALTTIYSVLNKRGISLVGGTGDAGKVSANGKVYEDSVAYALIRNDQGRVKVYKENIYHAMENTSFIASKTDKANYILGKLNGMPAKQITR